jgi:hypothetical protein
LGGKIIIMQIVLLKEADKPPFPRLFRAVSAKLREEGKLSPAIRTFPATEIQHRSAIEFFAAD